MAVRVVRPLDGDPPCIPVVEGVEVVRSASPEIEPELALGCERAGVRPGPDGRERARALALLPLGAPLARAQPQPRREADDFAHVGADGGDVLVHGGGGELRELLAHRVGGREAAASFLFRFRNSDIQPTTSNLCYEYMALSSRMISDFQKNIDFGTIF